MIINGALECGGSPSNWNGAANRANYYKDFAAKLGVNIVGEKLTCSDSTPFTASGSSGALALYWAPESGCTLVSWQTAYSALVEGDYNACKGMPASACNNGGSGGGSVTTAVPATTTQGLITSGPVVTTPGSGSVCSDPWGFYPHESDCQK